jgi:hypothetical protein
MNTRHSSLVILILSFFSCNSSLATTRGIDTVTARKHLEFLASDDMRGRNTPSKELERSAAYIEEQFRSYGLKPLNGSYRKPYELLRSNLAPGASLRVRSNDVITTLGVKTDFIPFEQTGEGTIENAPVVFAGFGITAKEYQYDDYAGLDVHDAVVLVMRGEPNTQDSAQGFDGKQYTRYSSVTEKTRNAIAHGAIGVLVVDAPRGDRKMFITGFSWPSLYPNIPPDAVPLTLPNTKTPRIPVIHVGERTIAALLGSSDSLRATVKLIDSLVRPRSMPLTARVSASVALTHEHITVDNVVGYLPGSSVPDEYVVMGAHYDHVGVGKPNADGDSIFNGADDNASGTTSILMCAEHFASLKKRPARGILFIAFSAEEKGLLGSKAYAADPSLPLDKCVAMINVDMIGRCENNKVSIGGDKKCPDLIRFNEEENAALASPYTLAYDIEQYFFRSDQASFAMKRIPVLFFFTGEHKDYHKVTDEIKLINFKDLVGLTHLISNTVLRATSAPRTQYVPAGFEE